MDGFQREATVVWEIPDVFPREEDIDTESEVWSTTPHPWRDMGGRIIPLVEAEFRRHLRYGSSPEAREEVSDDTEVMEAEPPGELERVKRTSTVEQQRTRTCRRSLRPGIRDPNEVTIGNPNLTRTK